MKTDLISLEDKVSKNENLEQQMCIIMDHFNFSKVAKIMEVMNWTWRNAETNEDAVPVCLDLRAKAIELLHDAMDDQSGSDFMSGGFVARNDQGSLSLKFILEEYDGCFSGVKLVQSH